MKVANVAFFNLCVLGLGACGCADHQIPKGFEADHPKIQAMRDTLRSHAQREIRIQEAWRGKPLQLHYQVAIDPRWSSGYAIGATDGGDDFLGTGVRGNLGFLYDSKTIDRATVAVVFAAVLGADNHLYSGISLYLWQSGRWISDTEAYLQWLEGHDPSGATELRKQLRQMETAGNRKWRLTTQPTTDRS